jgi:hypothetical protein
MAAEVLWSYVLNLGSSVRTVAATADVQDRSSDGSLPRNKRSTRHEKNETLQQPLMFTLDDHLTLLHVWVYLQVLQPSAGSG